ncbi:18275_t:CDS:2 [Dentiscutata erythropus]|uniref:18275_t:CDS:1 n=1 Tax=Dentiscutata erythropus TaxID=1348616 RepID=A0A9N9D2H7_9GLOM|nr:18275_t:CDS:2 [Dentiscutata erythropus]
MQDIEDLIEFENTLVKRESDSISKNLLLDFTDEGNSTTFPKLISVTLFDEKLCRSVSATINTTSRTLQTKNNRENN